MAHSSIWMMLMQEILAAMKSGKSEDEEERMRRIMRDVMSETKNASASERDMMHRMMQLMEHNVTKHSAELQATAKERDHYKAKMEELNRHMEQLMRDKEGPPSGGEGPGLTDRQKRLAEIWEELKDMRQRKRSDQTTQGKPFNKDGERKPFNKGGEGKPFNKGGEGKPFNTGGEGKPFNKSGEGKPFNKGGEGKPFNKGGERGRRGFSGDRRPQYQSQNERAFSQFGRQNKDGTPFSPGEYPSQGRDSEKLRTSPHKDYKSGGFQSKPFQQDNRYQEGPMSSPTTFTHPGGRDGRHDFVPFFSNTHDNRGLQSDNRRWEGDSSPGFSNRDAVQNVGMQNYGPNQGSYQHRGRPNDRGHHQQRRGQFNPHRGHFHQYHGQSKDGRQDQRSFDSGPRNPPHNFSSTQFSPEEIEAIKSVLKQREAAAEYTGFDSGPRNPPHNFSSAQFSPEEIEAIKSVLKQRVAAAEYTGKPDSVPSRENPSKTAVKKGKEKKEPKGAAAMLPDDSESEDEDAVTSSKELSDDAEEISFAKATDAKPVADSKKKKKKNKKNKGSKDQGAARQNPEGLSPLEVFTASGFNMSQITTLDMDQAVSDVMLITKDDGDMVSYQPRTVRELVEFKQRYPNAQAIIVKTSEQK